MNTKVFLKREGLNPHEKISNDNDGYFVLHDLLDHFLDSKQEEAKKAKDFFAKIFIVKGKQVLVTIESNDEDGYFVEFKISPEDVTVSAKISTPTEAQAKELFTSIDQEKAEKLACDIFEVEGFKTNKMSNKNKPPYMALLFAISLLVLVISVIMITWTSELDVWVKISINAVVSGLVAFLLD